MQSILQQVIEDLFQTLGVSFYANIYLRCCHRDIYSLAVPLWLKTCCQPFEQIIQVNRHHLQLQFTRICQRYRAQVRHQTSEQGILIEHFAGKFPLWMAPVQTILLPINDDLVSHANDVRIMLEKAGLRTEVDSRTESLNKKVRDAQLNNIPLILTIGDKEKKAKTLSVRTLDGNVRFGVSHEEFLEKVLSHVRERQLDLNIFIA